MESYRTLAGPGESLVVERRSRFLGHCIPAGDRRTADGFIAGIKAKYRDANHNVSGYQIRNGNISHCGDDGEPAGTAGLPVLDVLTKGGITDGVIVVTRYFGGTLLGTGGLVRAYGAAASAAVRDAGVAVMTRCFLYEARVRYPFYEPMMTLFARWGVRAEDTAFSADVTVRCRMKAETEPVFLEGIRELTRGSGEVLRLAERFDPLEEVFIE